MGRESLTYDVSYEGKLTVPIASPTARPRRQPGICRFGSSWHNILSGQTFGEDLVLPHSAVVAILEGD